MILVFLITSKGAWVGFYDFVSQGKTNPVVKLQYKGDKKFGNPEVSPKMFDGFEIDVAAGIQVTIEDFLRKNYSEMDWILGARACSEEFMKRMIK